MMSLKEYKFTELSAIECSQFIAYHIYTFIYKTIIEPKDIA